MSPQQKRPNTDVVEMTASPLLEEDMMKVLRQCDDPEYVPDTNLFAVMYDAGPEWTRFMAETVRPNTEDNLKACANEMAQKMTIQIQQEYDICLPDNKVSQLYAMAHDLARLALGIRIPAPEGRFPKKGVVMHKKRIREYAKELA